MFRPRLRGRLFTSCCRTKNCLFFRKSRTHFSWRSPLIPARFATKTRPRALLKFRESLSTQGATWATISSRIYESYPKRRILLLGQLLNEATFHANDRIATFSLTEATKSRLAIDPADVDGLIDVIRSIDTVVVAIFFEELEDQRVRISVRSKDVRIDANRICSTWGGGGHQLAAGARIRGTLEEVRTKGISYVSDEGLKY